MRQEQSRSKTPAARILSLALALCMIAAFVPAFTLTAGAEATEQTLFDLATAMGTDSGEYSVSNYGWTESASDASAKFNSYDFTDGLWVSSGSSHTGTEPTLMFFPTVRRHQESYWDSSSSSWVTYSNNSERYSEVTIDASAQTEGATDVTITFDLASQTSPANLYQTWYFRDLAGQNVARVYIDMPTTDSNNANLSVGVSNPTTIIAGNSDTFKTTYLGTEFVISIVKSADYTYTVTYSIGGTEVLTDTVTTDIDSSGFKSIYASIPCWNNQYAAAGMSNLNIKYTLPDTQVTVTASYKVNGVEVYSLTGNYDRTATPDGYAFPAYYYSADGSNTMYYTNGETLTESGDITMSPVEKNNDVSGYSKGNYVGVDGVKYLIESDNLIPNGDFTYGLEGWYLGTGAAATTSTSFDVNGDGTITCWGSLGRGSEYSIVRSWEIEDGETYLFTYSDDMYGNHSNSQYHLVFASNDMTNEDTGTTLHNSSQGDGAFVFTNTGNYDYVKINFRWIYGYPFGNFGLYKVSNAGTESILSINDISDVNVISGNDPVLPSTVTAEGDLGNTMTASVKWTTTDIDFTNTDSTVKTVSVEGTVDGYDDPVYVNVNVYPVSFTMDTITSKNTTSGYYVSFPYDVTGDAKIEFTLYYNVLKSDLVIGINSVSAVTSYGTLWGGQQIQLGGSASGFTAVNGNGSGTNNGTTTISVSAQTNYRVFLETDVADHTYSLTITNESTGEVVGTITDNGYRNNADKLDAFYLFTNGGTGAADGNMTVSNLKVYDPSIVLVDYTVEYVDENGYALDTTGVEDATGTYSTTEAKTLGYDDEEIVPYVTIPYFAGYIFTSKSVDTGSNTVTLTYTSTTQVDEDSAFGSNFFEGVDDDTQFVSLNMLGAHDAFTSSIDSSNLKYDAGGIAQGDSGSTYASVIGGGSTVANYSKAQEKTALELLEAGVRYFDIRLSRSTEDQDAGLLYNNAPHTNGVFYTTHGVLSDEFRPIAYTIGQWLAEHPGEVVVLDFQEAWDDGNASSTTYADINSILEEAGISDFAKYYNGTSIKTVTYGMLTEGDTAGVVMFARQIGYAQGKFYPRALAGTYDSQTGSSGWDMGKLYSYYDSNSQPSSFDVDYIQTQVDNLESYHNYDASGDHVVYHYARVMQAQSASSNLLSTAETDNSKLYTALTSASDDTHTYSEWLTALPIVMVDGVGRNTDELAQLLQNCNTAKDITITYVDDEGNTLATKTKSVLVGSLYTDETIYTIVDNSYDATNGSSVIYSLETLTTAPSTSYNSAVVFTPAYGLTADSTSTIEDTITIDAAKLADTVYTVRYTTDGTIANACDGFIYSSSSEVGTTTDYTNNTAFSPMNWGLSNYDRVGVAIMKLPTVDDANLVDYTNYILSATIVRSLDYGNGNVVKFYALSIDEYNALDISDSDAFLDALSNTATEVCSFTPDVNQSAAMSVEDEFELTSMAQYANDGAVVIIGVSSVGVYALSDMSISGTKTNYGVDLYAGAQIRVGSGMGTDPENTEEYQELLGDSGLRFIAVVDKTNTMAYDATEIGIAIFDGGFVTDEITAETAKTNFENATPVTKITDDVYQDEAAGVFTAAIINIAESNYNRIYVAVPYVVVNGETYYNWDATVARTPYQVAKGILVNGTTTTGYTQLDGDGNAVAGSEALINVLNVYTNKTGARVTIASSGDGYTVTAVTYANGATEFFDIASSTDEDGNYVFTLSPKNDNTKFYEYARDYFRIKNVSADTFEAAVSGASVELNDEGNIVITVPVTTTSGGETE